MAVAVTKVLAWWSGCGVCAVGLSVGEDLPDHDDGVFDRGEAAVSVVEASSVGSGCGHCREPERAFEMGAAVAGVRNTVMSVPVLVEPAIADSTETTNEDLR